MKFEFDTHKYAKLLISHGFTTVQTDGLVQSFSQTEIRNVFNVQEMNLMLSETMKEILLQENKRLEEQRREFDTRLAIYERHFEKQERRFEKQLDDSKTSARWLIGTIITVGLGLAGYLSALIHFSH